MMRGRRLALALPLAAAFAASGCVSLAARIAEPRGSATFAGPALARMLEQDGIRRRDFTTPDGVRISWLDVPAAKRGFSYDYQRRVADGKFTASFGSRNGHAPVPVPARGTIVFLHGWQMDATSMLGWAEALSERGWRGVAVDLRNFGESDRAPSGYGPREAGDIAALVDALRARGEAPGPAFLFGVSYGAATALFDEPLLRGRVAGIVAMEPFGNAAEAIRDLARNERDAPATGIARVAKGWARLRYRDAAIERAIGDAGRRLGVELATIDTAVPLAESRTCTLLLHGARDRLVPVATARRLAAAAPMVVRYVEFPDENHFTLPLRIDLLAAPLAAWMDAAVAGACPAFAIPRQDARATQGMLPAKPADAPLRATSPASAGTP